MHWVAHRHVHVHVHMPTRCAQKVVSLSTKVTNRSLINQVYLLSGISSHTSSLAGQLGVIDYTQINAK